MNSIFRGSVCALAVALAAHSTSQAGVVLITRGETISHVGNITAKARPNEVPPGISGVGFKYWYGGLFWVDFFTSDGTFCVYQDKTFWPITQAQAAELLGIPESELSAPFWYRFPPGWFIVGAIVAIAVVAGIRQRKKTKEVNELVGDARYHKALEVFQTAVLAREDAKSAAAEKNEPPPEQGREPWDEAIDYLVGLGIDKAEAEINFGKILAFAAAQAQPPPK
jgi:hypothetical protein